MAIRQIAYASTATLLLCAALRAHAQTPPTAPGTPPPPAQHAAPTPMPSAAPPSAASVAPAPQAVKPAAASAPAAVQQSPTAEATATPAPAATTPTQSPPPAAVTATPAPPPPAPTAAASAPAPAPTATTAPAGAPAKLVLRTLAERERDGRLAGAYSMFISGAAAITAGIIADAVYDRYYGKPLWIIGAIIELGGVMNLFRAGPVEHLAHVAEAYNAEQLRREWSERALAMRKGRKIGGAASFVFGALTIGTGTAIAAGLGDLDKERKQDWTIALIATGGGIIGSGLVSLLVESPLESGYRAAYGTDPNENSSLKFDIAPTVGGAALHLRASF